MLLADSNSSSVVEPISKAVRETAKVDKLGGIVGTQVPERLHVQVLDESMSPDLLPFDICVVDLKLVPKDGDIAFVRRRDGGICLRRYKYRADGGGGRKQFDLVASNPSYPPYRTRPKDGVRIAGVVVEYRRTTQAGSREAAE